MFLGINRPDGKQGHMATTVTDSVLRAISAFRRSTAAPSASTSTSIRPRSRPRRRPRRSSTLSSRGNSRRRPSHEGAPRESASLCATTISGSGPGGWTSSSRTEPRGVAVFASSADGIRLVSCPWRRRRATWPGAGTSSPWRRPRAARPLRRPRRRPPRATQGNVYRFSGGRLVEIVDETEETQLQHGAGRRAQARYPASHRASGAAAPRTRRCRARPSSTATPAAPRW